MKVLCTVGIELETTTKLKKSEYAALLPPGWCVHSDHSIPGGGWEGVSPILDEDDALSGQLSELIAKIRKSSGEFIDAPMPAKHPKKLKEYQSLCTLIKRLGKEKDPRLQIFLKEEIILAKEALIVAWKAAKRVKLKTKDDRKKYACGLHVHVGKKKDNGDEDCLSRKERNIAAVIYDFYYDRNISKIIVPSRDEGGSASAWAQVRRFPDDWDLTNSTWERYEAVNTTSEHWTIEYRQGSINQPISIENWISVLCDITRGAVQIAALFPDLKTAGDIKAMLPYKFKNFRLKTYEWSLTEEYKYAPETVSLKDKFTPELLAALKPEKPRGIMERVQWRSLYDQTPLTSEQLSATTSNRRTVSISDSNIGYTSELSPERLARLREAFYTWSS